MYSPTRQKTPDMMNSTRTRIVQTALARLGTSTKLITGKAIRATPATAAR